MAAFRRYEIMDRGSSHEAEDALRDDAKLPALIVFYLTGDQDIDRAFVPPCNRPFYPLYVRCHFTAGSGVANVTLHAESGQGTAWDHLLYERANRGTDNDSDLNLRFGRDETEGISPWIFGPSDSFKVKWTNPNGGTMNWGLEVGLVVP